MHIAFVLGAAQWRQAFGQDLHGGQFVKSLTFARIALSHACGLQWAGLTLGTGKVSFPPGSGRPTPWLARALSHCSPRPPFFSSLLPPPADP